MKATLQSLHYLPGAPSWDLRVKPALADLSMHLVGCTATTGQWLLLEWLDLLLTPPYSNPTAILFQ